MYWAPSIGGEVVVVVEELVEVVVDEVPDLGDMPPQFGARAASFRLFSKVVSLGYERGHPFPSVDELKPKFSSAGNGCRVVVVVVEDVLGVLVDEVPDVGIAPGQYSSREESYQVEFIVAQYATSE